jgi:leader peptidase (prepilin peptidase)/N-methyltransferase
MDLFIVTVAFCFGLVFGSFFNVVIYRLPRGLSLVKPGSSCPICGHRLRAGELIPVLSFLWQRGACRVCGEKISWRYPVVELVTGLGFAFISWTSSSWTELAVGLVFYSFLLVLALIDLDHKLLPNVLTLSGVGLGLVFSLLGWTIPFGQSVLGAAVGFAVIVAIVVISRGGMGMGDAKLMALIGSFLGWQAVFYVLFWGSVVGSISGIIYLYLTRQDKKTPLPFGPSLAAAAIVLYFIF